MKNLLCLIIITSCVPETKRKTYHIEAGSSYYTCRNISEPIGGFYDAYECEDWHNGEIVKEILSVTGVVVK